MGKAWVADAGPGLGGGDAAPTKSWPGLKGWAGLPVDRWAVQNGFLDACLLASNLSPQGLNLYRAFAEELELPASVVPGGVDKGRE